MTFSYAESYFVSEASVYRLLKAHDLITSPAFIVIKAADEFQDKTTAPNQLWQAGDENYLEANPADSDVKPAAIPIKDRPTFRFEAGQHSKSKVGQFSALNITSWVGDFGIKCPAMNGGDFDAGKEKADRETVTTNAAACRKRDELPRDCRRVGNSAKYGAG